jgi:ABC-type cobalamin/Fe3+-siderophores transport system ATPase subunit
MDLMTLQQFSVKGRIVDINLQLRRNEVMGLVGPNGAGKSSLLNAIAGILDHQGQIYLSGQELGSLTQTEQAQKIALQPQFIDSAWALSVHDIVSMGRIPWGDSDQTIIHDIMRKTNIEQFAERRVSDLSGGERARVWLARVLANQPQVLLVDEPVANLDIHFQQQVMQILQDYARAGHTVLIAIHDLSLAARYCDRVCLLNQGKQVEAGSVAEVLQPEVLGKVFGIDVFVDLENNPPVVMAQ